MAGVMVETSVVCCAKGRSLTWTGWRADLKWSETASIFREFFFSFTQKCIFTRVLYAWLYNVLCECVLICTEDSSLHFKHEETGKYRISMHVCFQVGVLFAFLSIFVRVCVCSKYSNRERNFLSFFFRDCCFYHNVWCWSVAVLHMYVYTSIRLVTTVHISECKFKDWYWLQI